MSDRRTILLVENDPADAELTRQALRRCDANLELVVEHTGDGAIERLKSSSPGPDLVLLDLNMPGTDGRAVLAEVRKHETTRTLPIIVLSTSNNPADVVASYAAGANAFLTKPMGFSERVRAVSALCEFWFETARLPAP